MTREPRIAFIGRADFGGLGAESVEFYDHFRPKTMIVLTGSLRYNLARFPDAYSVVQDCPSDRAIAELLQDTDMLFCIETPYSWRAFSIARDLGVKTALRINYEWLERSLPVMPDLLISPSLWEFDHIPDPKRYLPFPVNTDRIRRSLRTKADVFLHMAGNMKAAYDRNGTQLFLKAIPLVKSDVKFIIRSQVYDPLLDLHDPRVQVIVDDNPDYTRNWQDEADVLVMPRRYAGQSLPMNEAMARGMAIMATDMSPQSGFLPPELLIRPSRMRRLMIKREIEYADIEPEDIAAKIDQIAHQDISRFSKKSAIIADEWSWHTMLPKYKKLFSDLCS